MLRHRHVAIMLMLGIFVGEGAASAEQADNDDMSIRSKRSFYRYRKEGQQTNVKKVSVLCGSGSELNDEAFRSIKKYTVYFFFTVYFFWFPV